MSKKQPVSKIKELYDQGHRDFGENYVQELLQKDLECKSLGMESIRWHFIGHLQRNKVRAVLPHISVLHTLDSERLALELSKECRRIGMKSKLPVFVQINIDLEESKSGVEVNQLEDFLNFCVQISELQVLGFMTIPVPTMSHSNYAFGQLRELGQKYRHLTQGQLSMGMSSDYALAIAKGSTHIRVGTALFGKRN